MIFRLNAPEEKKINGYRKNEKAHHCNWKSRFERMPHKLPGTGVCHQNHLNEIIKTDSQSIFF